MPGTHAPSVSRAVALATLLVVAHAGLHAQAPLATITVGRSFARDSTALSFSFGFNRGETADPSDGVYLHTWQTRGGLWGWALKPSAEVNIGNGVDVSPNNVLGSLALAGTHFRSVSGRAWQKMLLITPLSAHYTADKNFTTSLRYAEVGVQFLFYRSRGPSEWRLHLLPGLAFDLGIRRTDTVTRNFTRATSSLSAQFKKQLWTWTLSAKLFAIRNDTGVVADGAYGSFTTQVRRKLNDHFGLSVEYRTGFDEPAYRRQNVGTLGFSFYQ